MKHEDFELPDGSYSVSDIQDYFKHKRVTDNPSIKQKTELCLK